MMSREHRRVTLAPMTVPPRQDLLLALGLAALSLLQVTVVHPIASTAVGVLVALAITLPVAWRRINPSRRRWRRRWPG
jgi:Flp pilus assembly protein TadB